MNDLETTITYENLPVNYFPQFDRSDQALIFDFFIIYSRFESTLKQVGFRTTGRNDRVLPKWKEFCDSIQDRFDPRKEESLTEAFDYYLSDPPKIQVLKDHRLSWMENHKRSNESDFAWVIRSIGIVRNNLFHGGKFPWDGVRDTKLLYFGLIILYECLELDNDFHQAFIYSPRVDKKSLKEFHKDQLINGH